MIQCWPAADFPNIDNAGVPKLQQYGDLTERRDWEPLASVPELHLLQSVDLYFALLQTPSSDFSTAGLAFAAKREDPVARLENAPNPKKIEKIQTLNQPH